MQKNFGQFLQAAPGILPNDVLKNITAFLIISSHTASQCLEYRLNGFGPCASSVGKVRYPDICNRIKTKPYCDKNNKIKMKRKI
jgi:hypothetical protein